MVLKSILNFFFGGWSWLTAVWIISIDSSCLFIIYSFGSFFILASVWRADVQVFSISMRYVGAYL